LGIYVRIGRRRCRRARSCKERWRWSCSCWIHVDHRLNQDEVHSETVELMLIPHSHPPCSLQTANM